MEITMKLRKRTWISILGILIALGGMLVAAEVWLMGAENYQSVSRRGGVMESVFAWVGGLIGDKPLAILFALIMCAVGYGVHKIGRLVEE